MKLTILIVCSESPSLVEQSIQKNRDLFEKYPLIIVDKCGGEQFKDFFDLVYFKQSTSFWFARRFGMEFVKTKYVLCLDVDTVLLPQYIEKAIEVLETKPDVATVALDYAEPHHQNHLAFGTSIWRTEQLKRLYDWRLTERQQPSMCECKYMWEKVNNEGYKVFTFPEIQAIHLKGQNPPTKQG